MVVYFSANGKAQAGVVKVGYHTGLFLGEGQREMSTLVTSDIDANTKGRARPTCKAKSMAKHALYSTPKFACTANDGEGQMRPFRDDVEKNKSIPPQHMANECEHHQESLGNRHATHPSIDDFIAPKLEERTLQL
ncbi:unnamed protein product [Ectocarpus fasciculatus]